MKKLRISAELALPAHEAQTQTFVVYGGKGMGKTNFGAVLAEELDANALRFAWFDPVGVAWGLKHSADGRGDGIGVLTLGGAHGGIPIHPTAGAVVADLVVDEDVSVIVDVSRHGNGTLWTNGEKIRFARDYFVRLYQRQGERKRPLMQIVDEAGRFVPQDLPRGAVEIMECVGAIEQLVELGRNVGVGVALITQRSARMRKSVSELAEAMFAFRTVGPRSLAAIEDWFEEHIERKHALELRNRIRELPRGTAMIVSPGWLGVEGEYQIRARTTFDSSATPVAGKERRPSGMGARVDLDHYAERMAETIEQAKADDPKELQRQLREAKKSIRDLEDVVETQDAKLRDAPATAEPTEPVVEYVEVPVIDRPTVEQLEAAIATFRPAAETLVDLGVTLAAQADAIVDEVKRFTTQGPNGRHEPRPRAEQVEQTRASSAILPSPPARRRVEAEPAPPGRPAPPAADGDVTLKPGARRMLEVLVGYDVRVPDDDAYLTTRQLATLSFVKPGGTFSSYLSSLRVNGLIEESGKEISASEAGVGFLEGRGSIPTSAQIHATYGARLKPGARRMLDELFAVIPDGLSRDELAERADVKPGGTFSSYLSAVRTKGLVDESGGVIKLDEIVFLGDRL